MSGSTAVAAILADLEAEQEDLDSMLDRALAQRGSEVLDVPTPAEGWSVRDQVSHLAYFDEVAALALEEPERFHALVASAEAEELDLMDEHLRRGRSASADEVMSWWREARRVLLAALRDHEGADKVEWFGPPMGLASFATARLMETWAHGQDVADAIGVVRKPSSRLRHVAHLGVRTRSFSYAIRNMSVPEVGIEVDLEAPGGEHWRWVAGPGEVSEPPQSVRGPALDFCLVVTERRHLDDTELEISGDAALEWMHVAQAYAGPPGPGRSPLKRRAAPR